LIIFIILIIKMCLNVFYMIYLEIIMNQYKRNEYDQLIRNVMTKFKCDFKSAFLRSDILRCAFSQKDLLNMHLEACFFRDKFPIKFTYIFGASNFILTCVSFILITFFIVYFPTFSYAFGFYFNFSVGLIHGLKSIEGIFFPFYFN